MEVIGGEMKIKRLEDSEYISFPEGTEFVVPANSSFKIIVEKFADYCCSYIDEK